MRTSEDKWASYFCPVHLVARFFFTINEIFKEFQGGVVVLDSTHSTSVASKIVHLCHFSAYVKSRIAPQNRQLVPAERLCKLSDCASESPIGATYARFRRHAVEYQLGGSNVCGGQIV